jgi:hypothetical protein
MSTPPMSPTTAQVKVPHEKIAMRAYEKWVQRGRKEGSHVQDWLEAERELITEFSRNMPIPGRR